MKIIGTGVDIVENSRIKESIIIQNLQFMIVKIYIIEFLLIWI